MGYFKKIDKQPQKCKDFSQNNDTSYKKYAYARETFPKSYRKASKKQAQKKFSKFGKINFDL